jgi:hypothetical protein
MLFGVQEPLVGVSPKVLRALLSRSYELVRHDIPRRAVEADFQMLEHAVKDREEFAKLFGITTISNPSVIAANFPYTITTVAEKLRVKHRSRVQSLIDKVNEEKGFDIKASDNKYHLCIKYSKTPVHKYSEDAVALLKKVKNGDEYSI